MFDDKLTAEEIEAQEIEARQRVDRLQALGNSLQKKLTEAISQRAPVEQRWLDDLRQYHGRYDTETETRMADERYKRSKVFANITRSKTNAAEARVSDMLFPADDRNWAIQPTPAPELNFAAQKGSPAAAGMIEQAKQRAQAMQTEIDDQLTESRYNIEARRGIHQAAVLGSMVLKGPVIVNRTRKAWQPMQDESGQSVQVLSIVDEVRPAVEWVDVWNFYPDLSAKYIEDAEYVFERKFLTRRQMRDLLKRPGFLHEQIMEVLRQGPNKFSITANQLENLRAIAGVTGVTDENRFDLWEYHGPADADDLRACGVELEDDLSAIGIEAVVLFVGNTVVFADLNPMETGERPYSVWTWEEDETCVFGYGVPFLMRTPQQIINSAWRMMMDNSGTAIGPQVVVKQGLIAPADGEWAVTPMKLWLATDNTGPVNDAFTTFEINSHQGEIANILVLAKQFADEETNLPLIAQGSMTELPKNTPAATTSMMMNAANTILRRMIKAFDDNITKQIVTRFYDWNMQFNPNEEIKGDFQVDARGSSALMVKEMQSQQLMQFAQFFAHPAFAPLLLPKAPQMIRKIAESMRLSVDEVVPTDEEIAQLQQQQAAQQQAQDPRIMAAQIRAQAEVSRAQSQMQSDQVEMQVRERMAQQDHAAKIAALELSREIKILDLAATEKLTLEEIRAQLAQTAIKERSKHQLFAAERNLKITQGSGI
ncbi:MAG: hypothetical protein LBR95_09220 [Azoarcus sp.]|jgi:hypothetical protein|nr:hypothetical protein [Azoarcus sp.]